MTSTPATDGSAQPPTSAAAPVSPRAVTVRYWAGARAAAGRDSEELTLAAPYTVASALSQVAAAHPPLRPVLAVASILIDGSVAAGEDVLSEGSTLEVLPPFAGG